MAKLTTNMISADGAYEFDCNFKIGSILLAGTFGGGTLIFSQSFDGIDYVNVPNGTFDAPTITNFISAAPYGRFTLSGATTPSIGVYVQGVYYGN